MRVRLYPGEAPGIRTWGEDSIVYSPRSGETYFLDSITTQGVLYLNHDWLDEAAYRGLLSARLGVDDDEVMARYVERLIKHFEESGLVEVDAS